ncbi:MAG: hydroxyacid dehydrogenase [Candidatus Pacebacteria bacterium]|nr:hydroxyacid dehydrogenase [Candidatus Paceibacterota bacterium]
MTYRILNTIGEAFDPAAKEILDTLGTVDYTIPTQEELVNKIKDYDIAFIGLGLTFHPQVIDAAPKLKTIVTATTGLDHIDVKYAEQKGIKVLSLKGEDAFLNTITGTAELALALMISIARNIPQSIEAVLKGEWDRESFKGHSLHGKTLGVVGLGRLGKWMARYGQAMGKKVIFTDPNVESDTYKKVSFAELLAQSDVISIHVHLTPETEYMFNAATFSKMKPNAYLVNTSRGKLVNETDLIDALEKKIIAGYATDVLDGETSFAGTKIGSHPLAEYAKKNRNLLIVPHIGGMTHESRRDTDVFMAEKLKKNIV